MALLSGSRLTHDLATSECLLLACRHAAITVGFKVIDRKRAIMMHMRVKRQHQRRTLLHQSNAHVAPAMNPTLVAFGTFEPALQIQIVFWKIGRLSTHKQPRRKTAHHPPRPPAFRASKLRASDSGTSSNASLIRKPAG